MPLTYRPANDYSLDTLVDILNRGFAGYVINVQFNGNTLLAILTRDSVDFSLSQVVEFDGKPVGVGLVARRGWTARLAAMGVANELRGQGVGKGLLANLTESLSVLSIREFILEVIEQNQPAVNLYQRAGFATRRRLVGLSSESTILSPASINLQELDTAIVASRLTAHHLDDLPWQLSGPSLMVDGPPSKAFCSGHACILISDPNQQNISIRTIFVEPNHRGQGQATKLVAAILAKYPDKQWTIPAICPEELSPIFVRNGFQVGELSQLQMQLTL